MRTKTLSTVSIALIVLVTSPVRGSWDGTLKLGGIVLDEEGDRSAVQETYNIHDGFSLSQIRLSGTPTKDTHVLLNLREINLDGRQGDFLLRVPSLLKVNASFDQHRQVFDSGGGVNSDRRDFRLGAHVTPVKWLRVSGGFGVMDREGDRLGFLSSTGAVRGAETTSELGTGYDYSMRTGNVGAEVRKDRRGFALDYRGTDFTENLNPDADRTGNVISARGWAPSPLYRKLTHMIRAAYGVSELASAVDYTFGSFQYTGVVRPLDDFQFKYGFDGQRIDHETTGMKTDRFQHDVDATFYHADGNATAGYSFETNDDDRHLTSYQSWRFGATLRGDRHTSRVRYSGREKRDTEGLTLLRNVESSRILADVELRPRKDVSLGVGLKIRDREFPDIGVEAQGRMLSGNAGYTMDGWGGLSGTYTFTQDEYTDLAAGYDVKTHVVTGRVDITRIQNLRLSGGLTYLDVGKDLNIEKSILFVETGYTVADDYHFDVKYNVYNYDDYVVLDRYYTANAVWFTFAYDFHVE
ncbi:MAG: hypothetical protein DHS20C21_17730 [Gemmatimonadota bacterium]|nr:MAG: hypothetical protein DHS20C21_17730 [Gemmatimonadota bacterium]